MKYQLTDFDVLINRRGSNSLKWDTVSENTIPLWLADMDFKCPVEVLNTLQAIITKGVIGYPIISNEYYEATLNWFRRNHNIKAKIDDIFPVTGVIPALRAIIEEFTDEADSIIIQTPVYHYFRDVVLESKRYVVFSSLLYSDDGSYHINYEHLEMLKDKSVKMFIFCSPHNPIGRVWDKRELEYICNFCKQNQILLVVDEIFCDLICSNKEYISCGTLSKEYLDNLILLNSPTKTFNLAGLRGGNVIAFNDSIKDRLNSRFKRYGLDKLNSFYLEATITVYNECESWLRNLITYLKTNHIFIKDYIDNNISKLIVTPLEGTYLMWINYKKLSISESTLIEKLDNYVSVAMGSSFGENGFGFFRLNIACPIKILEIAMNRLHLRIQG